MISIPLSTLWITKVQPDGSFRGYPIHESEYFKALIHSSEAIYEDYLIDLGRYHYKRPVTDRDEMSYSDFESLLQSLKVDGFKFMGKPIYIERVNGTWEVGDGQHRVTAMYFLYPQSSVEIDNKGRVMKWVI